MSPAPCFAIFLLVFTDTTPLSRWEEIYPPWGELDEDGEETEVDVVNHDGLAGVGWWTNNETALLRRGFNFNGEHRFTPLFSLQQRVKPYWRAWRGEDETNSAEKYV